MKLEINDQFGQMAKGEDEVVKIEIDLDMQTLLINKRGHLNTVADIQPGDTIVLKFTES